MDTVCRIQSLFFQNLFLLALLPPPFVLFIHAATAAATSTTATTATTASAPHTTALTGTGRGTVTCVSLDRVSDSSDGSCNSGRNCGGNRRSLLRRFIRNLDDRSQLAYISTGSTASAAIDVDLRLI
jgi:hypothetical protein